MAKSKSDRAERVVRDVCKTLSELHASTGPDRWIPADDLRDRLSELTDEQFDLAVAVAVDRGWLNGAGKPPHSVQLTFIGRDDCGLWASPASASPSRPALARKAAQSARAAAA